MKITLRLLTRQCIGACLLVSLGLMGCSPSNESSGTATKAPPPANAASAASAPAGPAVTVSTVKALQKDMAVGLKSTGTVVPLSSVEVRAQISSTVTKVHFSEGQFVKAGQLLFSLDSRTDQANAEKVRAQYAKNKASLADARRQYERAQQLFAQNFISQGALDTTQAQLNALNATLEADQAAINASQVALSFSKITAPQSGRAGLINVFAGSSVQANQTTLVTITQLDPITVLFSIAQRNLPDALAALQRGGANVSASLAEGGESFKGRLEFIDNLVDPSSGTVKAKAVFENKGNKLWPGAFVQVQQTIKTLEKAVVVPQACILVSPKGTAVYVVEQGKAVLRPVKVLHSENGESAVSGLAAGESVVQDGKQNVRPNSPVSERAAAPKAAASASAATSTSDAARGQAKATTP